MPRASITEEQDTVAEINLSPMIDCIFILLIFFIVTTVFVDEAGADVHKPDVSTYRKLNKNSIQIAITADDRVIYGGKEIGVGGVAPRIKQALMKNTVPVNVQCDEHASVEVFDRVVTEAKLAGAVEVNFSAFKE